MQLRQPKRWRQSRRLRRPIKEAETNQDEAVETNEATATDQIEKLRDDAFNLAKSCSFLMAIAIYDQAIVIDPTLTDLFLNRAYCYIKLEIEAERVIEDCNFVLKTERDNSTAIFRQAMGYKIMRK
jgi:tetratricopeptide (TPR) repeat protein